MFFPRLRRHAKWMFLFLALAFGLGFVGFGVGAGGVGVGDVFRDAAGGTGVPSISDSEQKVLDNPKDAQAFKDLATAYQAEGDIDQAVEAMTSYIALKPKDTDALRELAALYLQKASTAQERAQIYQVRSDYLAPGTVRDTIFQLGGSPLSPDPITNAVSTSYEREISAAASEIQGASAQAVEAYRKITEIQPTDPTVQLELAQAAQSANDTATVIAAYEAFLKLAPDDPTAPEVRKILKQYKQFGQRWQIAGRRAPRADPSRSLRDSRTSRIDSLAVRLAALVAAACAATLALALSGCGTGGYTSEGSQGAGKDLFVQSCGGCHALADAGTTSTIGPNLDDAFAQAREVGMTSATFTQVVASQIRYPIEDPVTEAPGMPGPDQTLPLCDDVEGDAFCVDDRDQAIADISVYVGAVAGTGITAERPTDGKSIFTANCGSCHTLSDAGTSGAVGPNLDESKPSTELVVDRVTNGQGAMPSFKDSLDADQIQAVSEYVAGAAGK